MPRWSLTAALLLPRLGTGAAGFAILLGLAVAGFPAAATPLPASASCKALHTAREENPPNGGQRGGCCMHAGSYHSKHAKCLGLSEVHMPNSTDSFACPNCNCLYCVCHACLLQTSFRYLFQKCFVNQLPSAAFSMAAVRLHASCNFGDRVMFYLGDTGLYIPGCSFRASSWAGFSGLWPEGLLAAGPLPGPFSGWLFGCWLGEASSWLSSQTCSVTSSPRSLIVVRMTFRRLGPDAA